MTMGTLRTVLLTSLLAAASAVAGAACSMGHASSPSFDADAATTLEPTGEPPSVYVAKVKNVLVGLPPTDAEVQAVRADPSQLKSLIDGWMKLPQYQAKMMVFFELAFQQTQISIIDFADQAFPRQADVNASTTPPLVQNARESFARTVLELIAEGRPFTEAITTQRFMMTPALMELYAFFDVWQVDDAGKVTDEFRLANPAQPLTVEAAPGPIPISETLDPTSANYLHWYNPDVASYATGQDASCAQDPIVYPPSGITLHFLLHGSFDGHKSPTGATCLQRGGSAAAPQFVASDFNTWKMVTIRPPKPGEPVTRFYDLPTLRSGTELVLAVPRVGFFTTPAFFANWQTNTSNQMRVTTNQTLIVATGAAVDGTDPTKPPWSSTPSAAPGLDAAHASDPQCFQCHQTLDPTRSLFASVYSWNYHRQTDPKFAAQKGMFAFQGVVKPVANALDLGTTLSQHPLFASAWAQKLCYYVNSTACSTDDPEFQRVVHLFQSSGYSWSTLVRELLSSPLTTNASTTKTTTDHGEVIAVSRRDHLCAALNNRLGFTDVCALDVLSKTAATTTIPEIVSGLPSDGYGRGSVAPVLPNQPSLFYRAGTENICEAIAMQVVDTARPTRGVKQWSSAQPDAAIADFVGTIMALPPSDPRAAAATAVLSSHFAQAKQAGASATDALRSTFIVACLAPSALSIGL
jgi:hypothetical protein